MEWLQKMNGAINYLEDNLANDIDYNIAAQIACCSVYHFQRMFSFIMDTSLSEYIRRRRLTLAAFELQNSSIKVIDVALKYGYDSPDSFARAFQNLHGVTPTAARDKGVLLKVYPKISFHISIKGNTELNYRIEEKAAFSVFGVETIVDRLDDKCFSQIPDFWTQSISDGTMDKILKAAGSNIQATIRGDIYGNAEMLLNAALYGHDIHTGTFKYMICQNIPKTGVSSDFRTINIPSLTWAIFPTDEHGVEQTTSKVQSIWKRVYSEWFPTSNYEHVDAPGFEVYHKVREERYIAEVWIPVVKKKE